MRSLVLACVLATACTDTPADDLDGVDELDPGPSLGKEDNAGISSIAVDGDYAHTEAWKVTNQWEDTTTPDAQKAGMAWPANSGLNWDQKYALWVGSFEQIQSFDSWFQTVSIPTPFGKSVPGPKLDCADLAILLRFSFAAWYHLPVYLVGYDGGTPVFFGHFGVRTAAGQWSRAQGFKQYQDYSSETPEQYTASWPQDTVLRGRGISAGDALPFLGPNARMGAFLDEIHLNKRAARLIMFTQAYLGSHNMVDSRNVYNLVPEAVRPGDVLMFARAPTVDGHTTIVTRVSTIAPGMMSAESIYGNDPPAQPAWQNPNSTLQLFTDQEGGGAELNTAYGGMTPYSHLGGGLKRFRVAKAKHGKWVNTWMDADEASWIDSTSYDAIAARPPRFAQLLGSSDPDVQLQQLLQVIADKRTYLSQHPSSCAARTDRESAFTSLYALMKDSFGEDAATVDAQYRDISDYVFAAVDYAHSPTCCWDSTDAAMYAIIMDYANKLEADAQANMTCVAPPVFEMTNGGYDAFASFAADTGRADQWKAWSQDESCAQAGLPSDTLLPSTAQPYCASH